MMKLVKIHFHGDRILFVGVILQNIFSTMGLMCTKLKLILIPIKVHLILGNVIFNFCSVVELDRSASNWFAGSGSRV